MWVRAALGRPHQARVGTRGLRACGAQVQVLEARDRVGGRLLRQRVAIPAPAGSGGITPCETYVDGGGACVRPAAPAKGGVRSDA